MAPRRYGVASDGSIQRLWNGKLAEDFAEADALRFMADTDTLLSGKVSADILAAIQRTGYRYEGGEVLPRPGKEEMTMSDEKTTGAQAPEQEAPGGSGLKLDVTARPIDPIKNLVGFANVKINDCFVVEDFKILQSDKGLYVGMPSKPDRNSRTGYRDTAKPITAEFRKELHGAILEAYQQEIEKLQARVAASRQAPPPEKESIKGQLEAGAKKAAKENATRVPKDKPAKSAER